MNLSTTDLQNLHDLAVDTAKEVGVHLLSRVGRHRDTRTKSDGGTSLASQIVTEVDLESQQIILDRLADSIQSHGLGLLSEESTDDSSRLEADGFWCIDPIDGTLPFVEGTPGYSISIALVSREGVPWIGVVHDPVEDDTFHTLRETPACKNGVPLPEPDDSGARPLTWLMDRSMKSHPDFSRVHGAIQRLAREQGYPEIRIVDFAGSALNGCWVADQAPALYFKLPKPTPGGGSVWDFAASACLMNSWERPPTDMWGDPLDLNPEGSLFLNARAVLYASHTALSDWVRNWYRDEYSSS